MKNQINQHEGISLSMTPELPSIHRRRFLWNLALAAGLCITGEALAACGNDSTATVNVGTNTTQATSAATTASKPSPVISTVVNTPKAQTIVGTTQNETVDGSGFTNIGQVNTFKSLTEPKPISVEGSKGFVYYQDTQLYVFSNICTHKGCEVQYDAGEKEFECPCHGSLYEVTGMVKHGPATERLPYFDFKIIGTNLWVKPNA